MTVGMNSAGSMPNRPANRSHSSVGLDPGGGTVTRCTRSRGIDSAQRSSTSGTSWTPQNHWATSALRCSSRRFVEERGRTSLVRRCLTFSCHSAGIWRTRSRAENTMWISASGSPERLQGPGHLHPRGGAEDLVADDRGARPLADLGGQPVPGAAGLALEPAPGQLHQVERGQEVGVVPVGGVEDAALAQRVAVGEQDVLDEGGAGLGSAHVEEYASGHASPPQVPGPQAGRHGQLEGAFSVDGAGQPVARWGPGRPDRRAQRSQRARISSALAAATCRGPRAATAGGVTGDGDAGSRWGGRSSSTRDQRPARSRTRPGPCGERGEPVEPPQQVATRRRRRSPATRPGGRAARSAVRAGGLVGVAGHDDVHAARGGGPRSRLRDGGDVDRGGQPTGGLGAAPHGAPLQDAAGADRGAPSARPSSPRPAGR